MSASEHHRLHRSGWLRAAVLGANDGISSVASLIVGVAAAQVDHHHVILTGLAGLIAGAISMAAGEYVSVQSQKDTENADLEMERRELEAHPEEELAELANIYIKRGLTPELAHQVAEQLSVHDALAAHAIDEIGITPELKARPIQAALSSAAAFAMGAGIPCSIAYVSNVSAILWLIPISAILALGTLGGVAAVAGGSSIIRGAARVCLWGTLAMSLSALAGHWLGATA